MRGASVEGVSLAAPFISFWPGLRMSIEPLNQAPSSMEILWQITSPPSDPSLRMSTRSLAVTLPLTLPRTTTSLALMLAWTWPLRPTVTRLPGRLMAPSTRPSMYSDSEPVTSPLMMSDLPMVACSWLFRTALRGAATGVGSLGRFGVVLITGFSASVVGLGLGFGFVVLAGFHICFYILSGFRWQCVARHGSSANELWYPGIAIGSLPHVYNQTPSAIPQIQNCWIGAALPQ